MLASQSERARDVVFEPRLGADPLQAGSGSLSLSPEGADPPGTAPFLLSERATRVMGVWRCRSHRRQSEPSGLLIIAISKRFPFAFLWGRTARPVAAESACTPSWQELKLTLNFMATSTFGWASFLSIKPIGVTSTPFVLQQSVAYTRQWGSCRSWPDDRRSLLIR